MKPKSKNADSAHNLFGYLLNSNMSTKISVLVCFILSIVFLSTVPVLAAYGHQSAKDHATDYGRRTLEYAQQLIEKEQQHILGLAEYYSSSLDIQRLLTMSNRGETVTPAQFNELLQTARFKMYLLSVVVYNLRGTPLAFVAIDTSHDPVPCDPGNIDAPFGKLLKTYADMQWEYIGAYENSFMLMDHSPKLVLWKKVVDLHSQKVIGIAALTLDVRKLINSEKYAPHINPSLFLISGGKCVVNSKTAQGLDSATLEYIGKTADLSMRRYPVQINNKEYIIFYQRSDTAPFVICTVEQPFDAFWTRSAIFRYVILLVILFTLALLPVAVFSSRLLTRPLKRLSESMNRFSEGDYSAGVNFKYNDDIGRLGKVFNNMVKENKRLIENNYILKLREKEAELAMLQVQIDPHFLYNMINSIYWNALKNHDEETADIAYNMGQFFRISLNRGSKWMTVGQSMELVNCYLKLQKQRFGKRVDWEVKQDPSISDYMIPQLIIQPLVENAIIHGMSPKTERLFIRVEAYPDGNGYLQFKVCDNGVGIPADILNLLPDGLDNNALLSEGKEKGKGSQKFAIRNISDRLHILYDDRYTFSIKSRLGEGTGVFLSIPIEKVKEVPDDKDNISG